MRNAFVVFILALGLGGCTERPYTDINTEQLKELISEGVPVYDIRRPEEWRQTGVVEGSRKLTFVDESGRPNPEFFSRFTAEVGKDDPVILICRTGNRTDILGRHLVEQLGYRKVYNVRDGISQWVREQHPVIKN